MVYSWSDYPKTEQALDILETINEEYPDQRSLDGQIIGASSRFVMLRTCEENNDKECVEDLKSILLSDYPGNGKTIETVIGK